PVGADMNLMVQFGQKYTWLQIECIELVATHALYQDHESHCTENIAKQVMLDGMVERGPGLYECTSPAAFLYLPPRPGTTGPNQAFRVVSRPAAYRDAASACAEATASVA